LTPDRAFFAGNIWDVRLFRTFILQVLPHPDMLSGATAGQRTASNQAMEQMLKAFSPVEKLVAESVFVIIVVCP